MLLLTIGEMHRDPSRVAAALATPGRMHDGELIQLREPPSAGS